MPERVAGACLPQVTVYYLPAERRFYVQCDPLGTSTLHYYGPFQGNPTEVLKLPPTQTQPASQPTSRPELVTDKYSGKVLDALGKPVAGAGSDGERARQGMSLEH